MSVSESLPSLQQMSRRALERSPDLAALRFNGRWYYWGELRALADRIEGLIAASGAGPRAAVSLVARNQPEAVAALLSLLAQGRTIRMIYPFQSSAGIARDIVRLRSAVIIAATKDLCDEVKEALKTCGTTAIALGDWDAVALPGFETTTAVDVVGGPEQPQIQILTSGTTGTPKQFPVSHEMIARHYVAPRLVATNDAACEPPSLLYFPIGNISGIYTTIPTLLRGQRAELLERFTLDAWRAYVREYRPVMGGGPPVAVQMILDADVPREELSCLRYFSTGAAPLDPTVQRAFEAKYGIPILLSYGATEFGGPVCAFTPDLHARWGASKFGSVGRPLPGAQVRVVDPNDGQELPAGQEGLLEVISPRLEPHWVRTTDVGVIDDDGFLYLRGRADGAIMRGGFKVLPETIERALLTHPAVAEAAVVGVADQRLGQVPAAAIRFKSDVDTVPVEDLETHLRAQILATHIPVHWRIVDEIPKNRSMKTDRIGVTQLFQKA